MTQPQTPVMPTPEEALDIVNQAIEQVKMLPKEHRVVSKSLVVLSQSVHAYRRELDAKPPAPATQAPLPNLPPAPNPADNRQPVPMPAPKPPQQ